MQSHVMLCAPPHSPLPRMKTRIEGYRTHLRPKTALSLPYSGLRADATSMYAAETHEYSAWLPLSSLVIVGRAVLTMVWSMLARAVVRISCGPNQPVKGEKIR